MNSEKHYRIKIWQEKDLCIEQVIKGAEKQLNYLELKHGEKLRMLQKDVNSSALAGDIKWQ